MDLCSSLKFILEGLVLSKRFHRGESVVSSMMLRFMGGNNTRPCTSHIHVYRWQKTVGPDKATPSALRAALTEMKLMGIVHTHFQ